MEAERPEAGSSGGSSGDAPRGTGEAVAVLDIGKTNLKLLAIDADGRVLDALTRPNTPIDGPPYLQADLAGTEAWLIEALAALGRRHPIGAIITSGYGSGAVLVDGDGPVLPMIDYETAVPDWLDTAYAAEAPAWDETFCATGAGAQRLAKQLLWLELAFPRQFARAEAVLATPQYWAWRLGGRMASELTTLGAQTHLWDPLRRAPTAIVRRRGWDRLLPPLVPAWAPLGRLSPVLARRTGLSATTEILCGIHDSNANWYRYRAAGLDGIALLSTGTWIIAFNPAFPLVRMEARRGMVANTDIDGNPIACTLTMTGREYALLTGGEAGAAATGRAGGADAQAAVAAVIADGTMALPSFVASDGAFPGSGGRGRIVGPPPRDKAALAALYAALSAVTCLEALDAPEEVVIDGGFSTNHLFAGLLAALLPGRRVRVSTARDGTAVGAALLWRHAERSAPAPIALATAAPIAVPGLAAYARRWAEAAAGR